MDHQQDDIDIEGARDIVKIENALKSFWDKAHAASDIIEKYKTEQQYFKNNQIELEKQINKLRNELLSKEQELKKLQTEHSRLLNNLPSDGFIPVEKENLKIKIKDLLVKINSHL